MPSLGKAYLTDLCVYDEDLVVFKGPIFEGVCSNLNCCLSFLMDLGETYPSIDFLWGILMPNLDFVERAVLGGIEIVRKHWL